MYFFSPRNHIYLSTGGLIRNWFKKAALLKCLNFNLSCSLINEYEKNIYYTLLLFNIMYLDSYNITFKC